MRAVRREARSKVELRAHLKLHSHGHLICGLCDRPPFRSQTALDHHRHEEHGVELKCACGKAYSSADHLKRHMKACVATGPSLMCNCGAALQDMEKFREHQEGCVISPPGATKAVKRRFSEIIGDASGEDREAAALQAFIWRARLSARVKALPQGHLRSTPCSMRMWSLSATWLWNGGMSHWPHSSDGPDAVHAFMWRAR